MKSKIFIVITFCLMTGTVEAQTLRWRMLDNSIIPGYPRFEDIYFINSDIGWVVDFGGPIYKTYNSGNNWIRKGTVHYSRTIGYFNSEIGLIGTLDSSKPLYRSINGGESYYAVSLPVDAPRNIGGISIVNENVAYACGSYEIGKIIKSTDKGTTWKLVFNDPSIAKTITDCYFWTSDSGIAVGGYNTSFFGFGNSVIIRTTDGGETWQRVYNSPRTEEWCWKISFLSKKSGFVSIERHSGYSYVLKTTNGGSDWIEIPFQVYAQQGIGFINENTGWIGGWTGPTYQTTNGGILWQAVSWGRNIGRFRFLNDTLAFAVGDRIYKYSIDVDNFPQEFPKSYILYQNYQNPFNPVTKIKFGIPLEGQLRAVNIRLMIYDALGKEVQILVNEKLFPGNHEFEFDGNNLSNGVYYYKLETQNFTEVKRMILLK